MFGKILYIGENIVHIENKSNGAEVDDLMNLHIVFESTNQRILGEIFELDSTIIKIRMLGEFLDNRYVNGVLRKPKLNSVIRIINGNELMLLTGLDDGKSFILGEHASYKNFNICLNLNSFFANHLAIFGNSGSGKSYGISRMMQNVFNNPKLNVAGSNFVIFDSFGEYKTAFSNLKGNTDKNYNYKFITNKVQEEGDIPLKIPLSLMTFDDYSLLLQADSHSQLTIIKNAIKYAKIFSLEDENVVKYKNHLIAKAMIAILYSNETNEKKKNEIFQIIDVCATKEFDFDTIIPGLGYTRTFSECFIIDSNGNFGESVLITDYVLKHIDDTLESTTIERETPYSLLEFQNALEFTLISGGFLHNESLHDLSIILKVRLQALINSDIANSFTDENLSSEDFIKSLVSTNNGKAQIININLEDIDDNIAKSIVKLFSRIFFDFSKNSKDRASFPIHIVLEEAHRYIQKDSDVFLLGYNIFERIAKEGRKYGVLLNIISQRPVEISETVISQVSNFLIFKMTHPKDIKYIEEMLPNISQDIVEKQKTLQPGVCVGFGSAFRIPMITKLEMPNPQPRSSSCDVSKVWNI